MLPKTTTHKFKAAPWKNFTVEPAYTDNGELIYYWHDCDKNLLFYMGHAHGTPEGAIAEANEYYRLGFLKDC